jgi:hypothetical protein
MPRQAHPFQPARLGALALACALATQGGLAHADERAELEKLRATTTSLIDALVENGLISRDKANTILKQASEAGDKAAQQRADSAAAQGTAQADAPSAKKPSLIRIPYITETTKAELREQIKQEVLAQAHEERWGDPGALPSWLRRIAFEGDLRVRFQHDSFDRANTAPDDASTGAANQSSAQSPLAWGPDLINTLNNRDRLTLRGRFGLHADLGHGYEAGLRLSTGSGTSPVGASQTQGNYANKYSAYFDQAFLRYNDEGKLLATAGRFSTPFYGTDLAWPDDLNLDGAAISFKPAFGAGQSLFMTAGVFPLQELEVSSQDKWLYGAQVGMSLPLSPTTQFRAGLALYDFQGVAGRADTQADTSSLNASVNGYAVTEYPKGPRQKGNSLIRINYPNGIATGASTYGLASRFKPLDLTADVTFLQFFPITVKASFDFIKNLGFDLQDIKNRAGAANTDLARDGLSKQTNAVQVKLTVGHDRVEKAGQWQSFITFRRFERDAWLDAFTDTTWHLGGTNYQGWSLGGQYGIGPRTTLGARFTSTHNLSDPITYSTAPLSNNNKLKIDVFQLELNTRF